MSVDFADAMNAVANVVLAAQIWRRTELADPDVHEEAEMRLRAALNRLNEIDEARGVPSLATGSAPAAGVVASAGMGRVLQDIARERHRQDEKWGGPEHDDTHGEEDWAKWIWGRAEGIAEETTDETRHLFVEIAALAVAAIESWDRRAAVGPGEDGGDSVTGAQPRSGLRSQTPPTPLSSPDAAHAKPVPPDLPCARCGHRGFDHALHGYCDASRGGVRLDNCEGFVYPGADDVAADANPDADPLREAIHVIHEALGPGLGNGGRAQAIAEHMEDLFRSAGSAPVERAWATVLADALSCAVESMEILLAHCPVDAPIERENFLFAKEQLEVYRVGSAGSQPVDGESKA